MTVAMVDGNYDYDEDHNNHGNCTHDDFDNDMILINSITIYKHVSDQTERWLQLRFTGSNSLLLAGTGTHHQFSLGQVAP